MAHVKTSADRSDRRLYLSVCLSLSLCVSLCLVTLAGQDSSWLNWQARVCTTTLYEAYPCRDRLAALNLDSLELCRLRAGLNLLYKIIFAVCDIDSNSLLSVRGDATTRGHRHSLIQEHCTNNITAGCFSRSMWPQSGASFHYLLLILVFFAKFRRLLSNVNLSIFTRFELYFFMFWCHISGIFRSLRWPVSSAMLLR